MSKIEKILDKIKKLLALSTSSNVNEAATAAAMAQELMTKYKLSMFMVEGHGEAEKIQDFFTEENAPLDSFHRRHSMWKTTLAVALAKANNCRIYTSKTQLRHKDDPKDAAHLALVGRRSDADIVRYMYRYLISEIDRLTKRDAKGKGKDWANNFRIGATVRIRERLEAINKKTIDECSSSSAIIKINQEAFEVDKWIEDNMNLKQAPKRNYNYIPPAERAGRQAAQEINLDTNKKLEKGHEFLNS